MQSPPSRAVVIGLGASGLAAASLLDDLGAQVVVTDLRTEEELGPVLRELPPGTRTVLGANPPEALEGVELVVVSPGVPAGAPILEAARRLDLPVISEVELAWRQRRDATLVAVTGSNGKSTVTTMVVEMLRAGGLRAVAGGNLGTPACRLVQEGGWDHWVLEVSSFQSELFTELRPSVGVLLNLSQDHLERHATMEAYAAAKYRLFGRQSGGDWAVLNLDDPLAAATPTAARRRFFSLRRATHGCLEGGELVVEGEPLMQASELSVGGRHNVANALAAALAARALGVEPEAIRRVLASFQGLPHRHRTVVEVRGVRWVDDSKATNVGAAMAALEGYPEGSVHLILGGLAKGQDFGPLAALVRRIAARVYLIGRDAGCIGRALQGAAPLERCGTLAEAVRRAGAAARPGDTVLLAPACASFDQFADYAERGELFTRLAREEVASCR